LVRPPHNSEIIVREYAEQERAAKAPDETINSFFEFIVPSVILRDRGLSDEELRDGVIGSGGDGGIDSLYIFVDDVLVSDDTNLNIAKHGARVDVEIIQSKLERSFTEPTLNKFIAVTNDLLTLSIDEDDFGDVYNSDVRRAFSIFRSTYRALLRKAPVLSLRYRYVTVRPPSPISAGLQNRIVALKNSALDRFQGAQVDVELLGAAELWQLILRQPRQVRLLPTGRSTPGRDGYICLVSLSDANTFLRDEEGVPTQNIFEENVRDWQGLTPVNQSIAGELSEGLNRDFWWLNNGITVLCSEYRNDDNLLTVTNPQIVNGLQTCKEIVQYFDRPIVDLEGEGFDQNVHPDRSVLFKVIRVNDDDTRDRIIRATNSQNSVSMAMLRATDPFQRVIEEYLLPRDLYYERRKNYYSNRGRPSAKLISLPFMTQAVLTMFAFRPDDARARPSNPLKREEEYRSLFSSDISLDA
jgi:AIPR protein